MQVHVEPRKYQNLEAAKQDVEELRRILGLPEGANSGKCPFHDDVGPSLKLFLWNGHWRWKCWGACNADPDRVSKGTIVDAVAARGGVSPEVAIGLLIEGGGPRVPSVHRRHRTAPSDGSTLREKLDCPPDPRACRLDTAIRAIEEYVPELPDEVLAHRGIPRWVAEENRLAYVHDGLVFQGRKGRRYEILHAWMIPISDALGDVRAVKLHLDPCPRDESKSKWLPVGRQKHGWSTLWPHPSTYDDDGLPLSADDWPAGWRARLETELEDLRAWRPGSDEDALSEESEQRIRKMKRAEEPEKSDRWLVLCPGELKAMAVLGASMEATAITFGENPACWTRELTDILSGRRVAILFDDDEAGQRFRDATVAALKDRAKDLRAITLGSTGGKKIDANDVAREEGSNGLRKTLKDLIDGAPDLSSKPFDLEEHRVRLEAKIRDALQAQGRKAVILRSPVGAAKSTLTRKVLRETGARATVAVCNHALAVEYEMDLGPLALRLLSPDRMTREAGDDAGDSSSEGLGQKIKCPSLGDIKRLRGLGIPYKHRVCGTCTLKDGCYAFRQADLVAAKQVLVIQHAHLRMLEARKEDYLEGRVLVLDETALASMRWIESFGDQDVMSFLELARHYEEEAVEDPSAVACLRHACSKIQNMADRESLHLEPNSWILGGKFVHAWSLWLAKTDREGRNLLPYLQFLMSERRFLRCSVDEKSGDRTYWFINQALEFGDGPLVILDATAPVDAYREALGPSWDVEVWPEGDEPAPASEVIQFVDGRYPRASLWKAKEKAPTPTFRRICEHIGLTVDRMGIPWDQVGVVTHKCLVEAVRKELPLPQGPGGKARILHYSACRGLNDLRDCRLVALIGVQQPSEMDIAMTAISLFLVDTDPRDLEGQAKKVFRRLRSQRGQAYEVEAVGHEDHRLRLAWELLVPAELMQAAGRARFHERREWGQTVLVFSSEPFGPVTRAMTLAEHKRAIGVMGEVPEAQERIRRALGALQDLEFTLEDLAEASGLSPETLRHTPRCRQAIKEEASRLGLEFVRGGRSGPGRFRRAI